MSGPKSGCQVCGSSDLERVLDLGYQPLCNDFLPAQDAPRPQTFYPLCVCFCRECSLAQLDYVIPTEVAFGDQYTYLTGSSQSLIKYYTELAQRLVEKFDLHAGDTVIEIGSNDGTFLKAFQALEINVIGIDGSRNSSDIALVDGIPVIQQFFSQGLVPSVQEMVQPGSKIKLILGMNVLAHTGDINGFLTGVTQLMEPGTVYRIQLTLPPVNIVVFPSKIRSTSTPLKQVLGAYADLGASLQQLQPEVLSVGAIVIRI